ncbi:type II secretion system F family protein [Cupriavidus basilensis]
MLNWIRMKWARSQFNAVREDLYQAMIRDLDDAGTRVVVTDSARFGAWEARAAERGELVALAHGGVRRRLEFEGRPLSDALQPLVPVEEVLMIDGGLAAGRLSEALKSVIGAKQANEAINSMLREAMAQPAVGAGSIFGLSLLYGMMVWPPLVDAFPTKYWDAWALPLVQSQIWFAEYWPLAFVPMALVWLYWKTLPTWTGVTRKAFDRLPPWNTVRDRNAASLLTVLASLIHSGATVDAAFERIQSRSTPYMQWHIAAMRRRLVASGDDVVKALDTGLFSRAILDQIADAASSRAFDETLKHMGTVALADVVKSVKRTAAWANGLLIGIVGAVFLYMTAVQVIAVDDAGSRYTDSFNAGNFTSKK